MYIVAEKDGSGIAKTTIRGFSTTETLVQFLSNYRDSKVREALQLTQTYRNGHFQTIYQALSTQTLREWFTGNPELIKHYAPTNQLEILQVEQDLPNNFASRPNVRVTQSMLLELTAHMNLDYLPRV